MIKILSLFFLISFRFLPSYASYSESCKIKAKVLGVLRQPTDYNLEIKILSFKLQPGSHGKSHCEQKSGKTLKIAVKQMKQIPKVGSIVSLIYSYSDGLGEKGLIVSERWVIK